MSESKLDVYAEIKPIRHGWRWQIEGDVPVEFRNYIRRCVPGPHGPGGTTATRWGARRKARRMLRQLRRWEQTEPEVIS